MIVCKQCGHQNNDNDTFCGSCGKFLEWTGERIVVTQPEPEPEPPPPAVEPQPAHLGLIDRVKQAVGIEEAAQPVPPTEPAPAPPTPAAAPAMRVVPVTSASPVASTTPAIVERPTVEAAPSATGAPVAPPTAATPVAAPTPVLAGVGTPAAPPPPSTIYPDEPLSRRPTSVAPTVARPRQAPRIEPPTRRRPGDLICGQCGEGNDPVRHFCRRCGNPLDEAVVISLPWYRRLFNRLFGVRTREAGWRPRRVGAPNVFGFVMRIIRLAIAVIIIVGILAFLLVPPFHNLVVDRATTAFTTIRKIVHPNYDAVYPIGTSASTAIAGHLPGLVDDRLKGTYWAALPSDRTPTLTFHFASPQDLSDIGFTSGASPSDQFLTQPRPHAVHLVFSDGTFKDLNLADTDKAQFFSIDTKQVTSVLVQVESVWPTAAAPPSSVAIDEVEFRIKD